MICSGPTADETTFRFAPRVVNVRQRATDLRLYGAPSGRPELPWEWVDRQLCDAGTYWVVGPTTGHPHPRPVWGVWLHERLRLSIGSPTLRRTLTAGTAVAVHLGSGTDVVIVEGTVADNNTTTRAAIDAYNTKYDWDYQIAQYGALTEVRPERVIAWQAAGRFGRDSFDRTGRWTFEG